MIMVDKQLSRIKESGLLRSLELSSGIDFSSNDYLGYSDCHEIRMGLLEFIKTSPRLGSTGSRLVTGNSEHLVRTEEFLANSFGSESCLIFSSGYLANLGVITSFEHAETEFFSDELNHSSIIDGIRLSKCSYQIYSHSDLDHLAELLSASKSRQKIIVTESVFSMDGDSAPLAKIAELAGRHNAGLIVDEAHATGTSGKNGLGLAFDLKIDPERLVVIHTCGKALGAFGAFVCLSFRNKSLLLNKARTQIFTTALSPYSVEHIRLAVAKLLRESSAVIELHENIKLMSRALNVNGLPSNGSHIVPIIVGRNDLVMKIAHEAKLRGYFVKGIRSPAVKVGGERLRITLRATHKPNEITYFCKVLKEVLNEHICDRY